VLALVVLVEAQLNALDHMHTGLNLSRYSALRILLAERKY
jgi:hypothetical protein